MNTHFQDISTQYGSFLPALMKVINNSDGPVLELGMGLFSTPYLHYSCYPTRKLVSYENNKDFYEWLKVFKSNNHEIHLIDSWESVNISGNWSVVLIDHEPTHRRKEEVKRLTNNADFIVIHDSNPRLDNKYKYSQIYPLFRYRKDFNYEKPHTTVLSNRNDLSSL